MQPLCTSTALALMLALGTAAAQAADTSTQAPDRQRQAALDQQPQSAQSRQQSPEVQAAGAVDTDGDGLISADEAAAAWVDTFHRLDHNGDDQLSRDELDRISSQKAMIDQRFAQLDSDGDGEIGLDEYASAGHDLMDMADLDDDGNVSAWEYRAVRVTDR